MSTPSIGATRTGAVVRRRVVLALAAVSLAAGVGVSRAELVNHYESSDSTAWGCLIWQEQSSNEVSYKTVDVSLCGAEWSYGSPSSSKNVRAERTVRECSYSAGCGDTYRQVHEGSADDAEFSIDPTTGVFVFNVALEGEDGSVCVARGTATTTETGSSTTSGPMWRAEGGRDWSRVAVYDGRTERGVNVGFNPSYPYASLFQNDQYWSARSGSGSGEACGWVEAQGPAGATMYTYSYSNSSDSVAPQSPVSPTTTVPEPPDPNDPPSVPENLYLTGFGGVNRGGYSEGVTASGGYVGVFWYQGADQWLDSGSDARPPSVASSLWAYVDDTYFELPLTPASVVYDPVADRYLIDASVQGCEVHLTLADPSNQTDGSGAIAGAAGQYAAAGAGGSSDPWVYTGTAGSWTGSSLHTFSYERRTYSGTVCGTAAEMPGDVAYGMYGQVSAY